MKKIMFYINVIDGGGAERVMTNLASQFSMHGIEVVFVTSYRAEVEYKLNEKVKRISLEDEEILTNRVKKNLSRIKKLRNICKIEKPELLISFMGEPNFRAVVATIGLKTKTIISVRNDPNKEYAGSLMRFVGRHILPLADGYVFQTEEAMQWFPAKMQNRGRVIVNAVKEEFYTTPRKPKTDLIVTCGRLQPQKNHKMLIDAIESLHPEFPDMKVKVYGDGKLEKELKEHIASKGLQNVISLEGQTNNVPEALSEADIFVLTSDYEGMPNALLEAMAMGIPCIATDCPCGGPKSLLDKNRNGLLIPVGGVQELTDAIKKLLLNPDKKNALGCNANNKAKEFSENVVYGQWRDYFVEVLETSNGKSHK